MSEVPGLEVLTARAQSLVKKGNLPLAEMVCRRLLELRPDWTPALNLLGVIAWSVGAHDAGVRYLDQAKAAAPDDPTIAANLRQVEAAAARVLGAPDADGPRYLLIKAWGYGFWADVDHLLGQLLLAEITGRTPVVHWGRNSLFGPGDGSDALRLYFEPVSEVDARDLARSDYDFFPPKWAAANLFAEDVGKWHGPQSRMAGLYYLNRPERVAVSDFHTGVAALAPWIPPGHPLHGRSTAALYRHLVRRHLKPRPEIMAEVEAMAERLFGAAPFLAVHARGSDKAAEFKGLADVNTRYFAVVDRRLEERRFARIFLLTDSAPLLRAFRAHYGPRLAWADCLRTASEVGLHYQRHDDRRRLGLEVMRDAYLAARADAFVGNGGSNVSCMVEHLKDWPEGDFALLWPSIHFAPNAFLHDW